MDIIALVVGGAGLGLAIASWLQNQKLKQRFAAALGGSDHTSLESTLSDHIKSVAAVDSKLNNLSLEYERLSTMASLASQKISIVRFNPFGDTGGDQSFSLAVLDAHDSGYVLTSIHGRQGTRVYAKPIDFGKSKYTLSAEEQQALQQAAKRVPKID